MNFLESKTGSKSVNINSFNKDYLFYLLLIVFYLAFFIWGHPAYSANDDFAMMSIAAGFIDGVPDAHLVFSNILIGEILKFFYNNFSGINWYTVYLLLTLSISHFVILRIILKVEKRMINRIAALFVFYCFAFSFFFLF